MLFPQWTVFLLLKLPGFSVSMGQLSLCKVTVGSIFLSLDQIAFGATHVDSVSVTGPNCLGNTQPCGGPSPPPLS